MKILSMIVGILIIGDVNMNYVICNKKDTKWCPKDNINCPHSVPHKENTVLNSGCDKGTCTDKNFKDHTVQCIPYKVGE